MSTTKPDVSVSLFARAQRRIPGGVNSPVRAFRAVGGTPFYTASANGCRLRTADGRELVDYVLAWGPAIHGHNAPEIAEAVAGAAARGLGFGTCHEGEVRMAELLCSLVPVLEKVRLTNSGTEATMSAVRLARGFTGRAKIIKFAGCFHGHVDALLVNAGSGALTFGTPDSAGVTTGAAADTVVVPYNDPAALAAAFAQNAGNVAAVIMEPFPGNVGLLLPRDNFLATVRAACDAAGALLIFDEVMTGFRVTLRGTMGVHDVRPDLVCLGKIIGGGLPVGAFGGRAEIMDRLAPLGPVYQSGTFCGHPVTTAAGTAAIEKLVREQPHAALSAKAERIAGAARAAAARKGIPLQTHTAGGMLSLFFNDAPVRDLAGVLASDTARYTAVFNHALAGGVFLPPSAFESWFISTAHDDAALDQTCDVLAGAIAAL
ncbi:MAG: glutamate-1-semialdehyde 2,1-aminomutase [Puniceicoccales bacterium]|jgi:glutamate-1-semialdehyde 2,1-aminomutase|nr:glutamate-1-semialdehyde 2,1-aminomutase [Puniceicoccales bacterium]